ncbi:MAG: EamA family transporter [Betaproteobacteria bacterium HGW-Betaproteobacteria-11]|nr:MAG: EamA family transporter [Betaproteobacteria bacterium HGW-Betaproteobacteria-11]
MRRMPAKILPLRTVLLTALTMLAFAGNSLLCRLALKDTAIDAASFTTVRLVSGALALWLLVRLRQGAQPLAGNGWSACALFVYAAGFSFAYLSLPAATGALLLFGAVQATMIGYGYWRGERFSAMRSAGFLLAVTGLIGLLLPGLSAPPLPGALLMLAAGISWGIYSLRGKGGGDPTRATAGNFLRAVPFAVVLSVIFWPQTRLDASGFLLAVASGALTSGLGYALWYAVLPALAASTAATVQLSVPVIATVGAVFWLNEAVSARLVLASLAVLGGIALVIRGRRAGLMEKR